MLTSVYPVMEDRGPMADVDFLVREEDWERTLAFMEAHQFAPREVRGRKASLENFYEKGFFLNIGNGREILFEVHRHFVQPSRHPVDYNDIWKRAYDSTFDGVPCKRISDSDHLLHLTIHLLTHRFTGLPRAMRDLELLFKNGTIEWNAVVQRSQLWKCKKALWLTLSLFKQQQSNRWTEWSNELDDIIHQTEPNRMSRNLLEHLVTYENEFIFRNVGLRKEEAILWPLLMDDMSQGARFLRYHLKNRLLDIVAEFKH
jgi:hypothetical protein